MKQMKFAIDLTWVRHKIVGGTESFVNNLIQGFISTDDSFEMLMIAAKDNAYLFTEYCQDARLKCLVAPVESKSVAKRIIWQNLCLSSFLKAHNINLCLEPVYAKPILGSRKIKWVTVIHDLEALHFPENHSWATNRWLRLSWRNSAKTSNHVISISDFVRNDIISRYGIDEKCITTIYDPIIIDTSNQCDFSEVAAKYKIAPKEYYYTVSKLNPHKNLTTLVKVFGEIKKRQIQSLPCKLLISGVNGGMIDELHKLAKEHDVEEELILTGFVEDNVRNCLYIHAKAFLFPSIFEGFGMPPIEAICCNTLVVTTRCACIPEITQHLANYVNNPYSVEDWIEMMVRATNRNEEFDMSLYYPQNIARKYLKIISEQA